MSQKKAFLFIDGFNLYHSLDKVAHLRRYKWLDLRALGENLISSFTNETLSAVYYFTAYATWAPDKESRHRAYVAVNENRGCNIVLGRFQNKEKISLVKCGKPCINSSPATAKCHKKFMGHEEKLTDVNIAVYLLRACIKRECDVVYLLSGDNDLIPALEMVKELCPTIKIRVVLPINSQAKNLIKVCKSNGFRHIPITENLLQRSQFPDVITVGDKLYTRPPTWT